MSSGIAVASEVINLFDDMKIKKQGQTKRMKWVLLHINSNEIVAKKDKNDKIIQHTIEDTVDDPFALFIQRLKEEDCCYAIYDFSYETKESKRDDLVLISWVSDDASCKNRMIYASSKAGLKNKLSGIRCEWQVNGRENLEDLSTLASKLCSNVTVLEGRPV